MSWPGRGPGVDPPPAYWRCLGCRTLRSWGNGIPESRRPVWLLCAGKCEGHTKHTFVESL